MGSLLTNPAVMNMVCGGIRKLTILSVDILVPTALSCHLRVACPFLSEVKTHWEQGYPVDSELLNF